MNKVFGAEKEINEENSKQPGCGLMPGLKRRLEKEQTGRQCCRPCIRKTLSGTSGVEPSVSKGLASACFSKLFH